MMLMNNQFRIGAVYCATPALAGAKQQLIVPIGRQGHAMQIALVSDFSVATVAVSDEYGREFARLQLPTGCFTTSSACEVGVADYANVRRILGIE